jgi:hypothetical protein
MADKLQHSGPRWNISRTNIPTNTCHRTSSR